MLLTKCIVYHYDQFLLLFLQTAFWFLAFSHVLSETLRSQNISFCDLLQQWPCKTHITKLGQMYKTDTWCRDVTSPHKWKMLDYCILKQPLFKHFCSLEFNSQSDSIGTIFKLKCLWNPFQLLELIHINADIQLPCPV